MQTHDEVEAIVSDRPSETLLRARIRATLLLRDYTTTSLVQETERLYMALDWIALNTTDPNTKAIARRALDPTGAPWA
jgi:hypothetical protein